MRPIILLPLLAIVALSGCDRSAPKSSANIEPAALSTAQPTTLHFKVGGMVCEGCEEAITETVRQMPGVVSVQASHSTGAVDVQTSDPSQRDAIGAAIVKLNYTIES